MLAFAPTALALLLSAAGNTSAAASLQPAPAAAPTPAPAPATKPAAAPAPSSLPNSRTFSPSTSPTPAADRPLTRIAFGSCAREREAQPIWTEIVEAKPELFLFIGDNHYADFWVKNGKMGMHPVETIDRIHEAYDMMALQPGYQAILKQCRVLATWDDHDFGANDAGREYPLREPSKQAFFNFYGVPTDSPLRQQPGIYSAHTFGPAGQRVQIILLDTRFDRDPLERATPEARGKRRGPYTPTTDTSKQLLGQQQWSWLEQQLRQPADIRIIATSIQVVADEHGFETWGNFPHERQRLYNLIDSTNASGVFFLSGDRHLTEISADRGRNVPSTSTSTSAAANAATGTTRSVPYTIWDFTSSGMNLKTAEVTDPNSLRVGPARRQTTYGLVNITWGPTPEQTRIDLSAMGESKQLLTRQTLFLADLRKQPAAPAKP